jgi:large subunit ribosomal protein L13
LADEPPTPKPSEETAPTAPKVPAAEPAKPVKSPSGTAPPKTAKKPSGSGEKGAAKAPPTPAAKASTEAKAGASKPAAKPAPKPAPVRVPPAGPPKTVVDASGLVLGRAASVIAKRLLNGEWIVVVHSEKSVVTGNRANVLEFYTANRARGSKRMGPHYPRYPDRIFRRTVRGMLPHLKTRGKEAFDRLEVHIGCPDEYVHSATVSIDVAKAPAEVRPAITLGEISRLLGAHV